MTSEFQTPQQIVGYDLARAVAILGMVVHHFEIAMVADAKYLPCWAPAMMALTWYFAHIYAGLGTLVVLDAIGNQSPKTAVGCGCGFFVIAVCLSAMWKTRFHNGPLNPSCER